MEIIPKLDIDKDIEFLETGSLCHASNVVITNNNDGISNEPAIDVLLELENGERIVGYIACSDEFVIFTSNNKIIRYNEKTKTSEEVKTNWNWEGGKVIGTYTYNVNNELIISITEISDNEEKKIPLKIINLNKPYFKEEDTDNKYTLAPDIPKVNLINYGFVTGSKILKGVYNLFIRFKIGDDYTSWFPVGIPINVYNLKEEIIERNVIGYVTNNVPNHDDGPHIDSYEMKEYVNDDLEITAKNIIINLNITDTKNYEQYQIGYSVSTIKGGIEVFNTIDYDINNKVVIIDNYKKDNISFDELTRNVFNIYNVKTICNYNNRLYLANYKEENPNKDIEKIDTSGITVKAVPYTTNLNTRSTEALNNEAVISDKEVEIKTAINFAVYNFFIHYIYPNGNYTDGVQIQNNRTYNEIINLYFTGANEGVAVKLEVDEDTTVDDIYYQYQELIKTRPDNGKGQHPVIKLFKVITNVRFCNIFPSYSDGVALYKNINREKLFTAEVIGSGSDANERLSVKPLKYIFENISIPEPFVGFFISYEKTEPILVGEGVIIDRTGDLNIINNENTDSVRFYYPEFNIVKQANGGNILIEKYKTYGGIYKVSKTYREAYEILWERDNQDVHLFKEKIYGIKNADIITPNTIENKGREGFLRLTLTDNIKLGQKVIDRVTHKGGILLNIKDNIYLSKNKLLTSLGYIQYKKEGVNVYTYGNEDYLYNYDYYKSFQYIYSFNRRGIIYDEVNPQPKDWSGNDLYKNWDYFETNIVNNKNVPLARLGYTSYSLYFLKGKTFNNRPVKRIYTFNYNNNKFVVNSQIIRIYPLYINDMFKLPDSYIDYAKKIIINFNKEIYSNFIEYYGQTIRRSDIINDESVENSWRIFRPEEYKVIAENKGNIINLAGVGIYLIAHCEHSMFVFNRNNTMQTKDKDVQLIIPDAFEIDYSEIFTSQKGYAGIQKFNQWCISNYGYIFYDNDNRKLYKYDNNNLDEISIGFNNLFKSDIEDINFVIDEENTRLICIGNIKQTTTPNKFAISYNFNTKSWISTHSYWYEDCFNTKSNCYFINNNTNDSIDTFIKTEFNDYSGLISDDFNLFKTELDKNNKPYSFIDVVFNNDVKDKVLDYITYSVTKNNNDIYSGDKLLIYTNCCNTDYIDISKPRKSIKDYKSPVFKFGVWVFNWFMNKVLNINTNNPIIRGNGKFNLDVPLDNRKGLDNKLVVGKYFVVRFIFRDETNKINVNDIQCY